MNDSFHLLYFLASSHALCLTVFLRRDFGREAIGMMGLAAGLMILTYGSLMNSLAVWYFFLAWILAVLAQRIRQHHNWRTGVSLHSRYPGDSWLAYRLFPRLKSEPNARAVDAFLCLAIGGLLTQLSPPLGWFVMTGFVSILVCEAIRVELTRKRLQAMRDAQLEQQYIAQEYQQGRF
jgi:hypothetical protein